MRFSHIAWDLEWERKGFLWGGDFENILLSLGFTFKTAGFMLARAFDESMEWALPGIVRVRWE